MKQLARTLSSLTAVLGAAMLLASTLVVATPAAVSATGTCPVTIHEQGSTTVSPVLFQARPGFQTANGGTTLDIVENGSGPGLSWLIANPTTADIAASSRPLKSGNELNKLYPWQIGGDAMVIAVQASSAMNFISQITEVQVKGIYNGTITTWDQIDPSYPNRTIVPRSRIIGSGSRDDLFRLFGVTDSLEQTTITGTGLPRLTTSQDEATAACQNQDQIVYTSLYNLNKYGSTGEGCLKALSLADGSTSNYVAPSVTSVQNGSYPAPRQLFLAINKFSVIGGTATTDTSSHVKGYDLINYMLSSAGQTAIAQAGFVQQPLPATPPIPNWDINLDGAVGLADIGNILGRWGQSSACPHWIRADANPDAAVGLADIGKVLAKWGGTGFVAP